MTEEKSEPVDGKSTESTGGLPKQTLNSFGESLPPLELINQM